MVGVRLSRGSETLARYPGLPTLTVAEIRRQRAPTLAHQIAIAASTRREVAA